MGLKKNWLIYKQKKNSIPYLESKVGEKRNLELAGLDDASDSHLYLAKDKTITSRIYTHS